MTWDSIIQQADLIKLNKPTIEERSKEMEELRLKWKKQTVQKNLQNYALKS